MSEQFDRSESFDTNWPGPAELKPRVYRTQNEKDSWNAVAVQNEYKLGPLVESDVVIDIGAHIGSFSHLAYRMGSRSIYAFEIDPWHFEAGVANLLGMDDGVLYHHAAVVRGDEHRAKQYYYNGAWNSFGVVGTPVDAISLDEILAPHESVRFLKIDCEGGEYPIFFTCTQLHKVQEIAGEYHLGLHERLQAPEMMHLPHEPNEQELARFLYEQGFEVKLEAKTPTIGNFYARRRQQDLPLFEKITRIEKPYESDVVAAYLIKQLEEKGYKVNIESL